MQANDTATDKHSWRNYTPLLVVIWLSCLAASVLQTRNPPGENALDSWMLDFMGIFLLFFALFKLINLRGFADGFSMYDLLASRWRAYGFVYPFLELGLSIAYLGRFAPTATYTTTVLLMAVGALGVFNALRRKMKVNCACLGTVLKVPLSTIAVVENVGMVLMATGMLARTS